jgi:hypothetical protein
MHERGKSDNSVAPAKPPNKAGGLAAEVVEGRGLAKGNTVGPTRPGRSAEHGVPSGLDRVREVGASRTLEEESCRRSLSKAMLCKRWRWLALRRRPTGAGVKPPCAALAEDRRGERQGEGVIRSRQVGTRKTYQNARLGGSPPECRYRSVENAQMASKPRVLYLPSG